MATNPRGRRDFAGIGLVAVDVIDDGEIGGLRGIDDLDPDGRQRGIAGEADLEPRLPGPRRDLYGGSPTVMQGRADGTNSPRASTPASINRNRRGKELETQHDTLLAGPGPRYAGAYGLRR